MIEAGLAVLRFSAPVALAGIGESLGQRAGLLNIGLEGMMLTAAFASMQVSATTGSPWAGLAAGVAAAVLIGLLQALFTLRLMLDQVVVGTAVNLFALGLTGTLFRALYGGSGRLISVPRLPSLPGGWDPFLLFIPIAALAAAWLLARSRWGLGMRAAGEKPEALQAAGFSVPRLRWGAALIAAAFAGLAGSYYTLGITGSFAENTIAGRGFVAIAMVTFGRWNPLGVVLASLLVGLAEQVQFWLQSVNQAVPYQIFAALPYVLALAVLVVAGKGTRAPASLGRPYEPAR